MRPVRAAFLLFIVSKLADGKGQNNATSTSGLVDFIREAVWGDAKEGGGAYGQTILPRHSNLHPPNQPIVRESNVVHAAADEPRTEPPPTPIISSVIGGDRRDKARQLMKAIEVESDGRTVDENGVSNGACYVGACCGWGHRLMRQVCHYGVSYHRCLCGIVHFNCACYRPSLSLTSTTCRIEPCSWNGTLSQ